MTRDEAKDYVRRQEPDFLPKAKRKVSGKNTYICPSCGKGSNGDGIARDKDNIHYKCFGSCQLYEDVIGLWKLSRNITDDSEAFNTIYEYYNITIDQERPAPTVSKTESSEEKGEEMNEAADEKKESIQNFNNFFLQANKDIEKTDYHRGISLETLNRFYVGYVENWKHPKAPNAPASPRLIIPVSRYSYVARDTRNNLTEEQEQFKKQKAKADGVETASWIYNEKAITEATRPIVVVEGEIDALSIIDVGGEAVALGSIANINQFIKCLEDNKPVQPLVLSLDNDKKEDGSNPGQKAQADLKEKLDEMGIKYYEFSVNGDYKDANEYLMADREAFTKVISFTETAEKIEKRELILYRQTSVKSHINEFIDGIANSVNTPCTSTGFYNIDNLLDGGLYEGLYIIGAISSLGKTTFALQVIDQIAKQGQDVIIFSLEMAASELMAKSISRNTFLMTNNKDLARTTRGITAGKKYEQYSIETMNLIKDAVEEYSKYANHIFINEGIGDIGVTEIRETVKKHISITGNRPVVLIDYMQILAPYEMKATDKQNTDKATLELKRMSRDFKIPVIAISSFNRENYTAPVNMGSFKESGAIEYSSDVLIGLQYNGMDYQDGEEDKTRKKRVRRLINDMELKARKGEAQEIQVKILKNRNGRKGETALNFYAMFNCFKVPELYGSGKDTTDWEEKIKNFKRI